MARLPAAGAMAAGHRLARDCAAIAAMGGALSTATLEVLAHRLPIVWATSPAPAAWQMAELWRMHAEKPMAAWQAWAGLSAWPFAAAGLMARSAAGHIRAEALALAAVADGMSALRAVLEEVHEQVAANARRLERQRRSQR